MPLYRFKKNMQRGKIHFPFSNKNYSYVLPPLLFDTLDPKTYEQQLDLLLEANIGHKHMQSRQTRTTKNNTPIKKKA
jgi:hypothetical protein